MEITLNILPAILITNSLLSTTVYHRRKRESQLYKKMLLYPKVEYGVPQQRMYCKLSKK